MHFRQKVQRFLVGSDLKAVAFMVPEGIMQASKGEKHPTVLPNYDACELQQ